MLITIKSASHLEQLILHLMHIPICRCFISTSRLQYLRLLPFPSDDLQSGMFFIQPVALIRDKRIAMSASRRLIEPSIEPRKTINGLISRLITRFLELFPLPYYSSSSHPISVSPCLRGRTGLSNYYPDISNTLSRSAISASPRSTCTRSLFLLLSNFLVILLSSFLIFLSSNASSLQNCKVIKPYLSGL